MVIEIRLINTWKVRSTCTLKDFVLEGISSYKDTWFLWIMVKAGDNLLAEMIQSADTSSDTIPTISTGWNHCG